MTLWARWLLVVDFPDERQGLDHMHVLFSSSVVAQSVLEQIKGRFGSARHQIVDTKGKGPPTCPWCGKVIGGTK